MKIITKDIYLTLVGIEDAEFIHALRTGDKRAKYLSSVSSKIEDQVEWIRRYKIRESQKEEYYFIICLKDTRKIGLVRIYDLKEDSFSWGSWIIAPGAPSHVGIESVLAVYDFGFYYLGFPQSHFEVLKENTAVNEFHRRFGAKLSSADDYKYYYVITKAEYEKSKEKYLKFYQQIEVLY